jgi:hypothetical protein
MLRSAVATDGVGVDGEMREIVVRHVSSKMGVVSHVETGCLKCEPGKKILDHMILPLNDIVIRAVNEK